MTRITRPRIDYIIPRAAIGGAERAVITALPLLRRHFDIHLIEALSPRSVAEALVRSRRSAPDIVVSSLWPTVPFVRLIAPRARWIALFHSPVRGSGPDRFFSAVAERRADILAADSPETARAVRDGSGRTPAILSFFVRPSSEKEKPPNLSLVIVGRNHAVKRLHLAADLVSRILDRAPRATATFVIAGNANDAITALEREHPSRVRVLMDQTGEPVWDAMASAHFVVSTSAHEGFGMALFEAMSLGSIPVATDVGHPGTFIDTHQCGHLLRDTSAARLDTAANWVIDTFGSSDLGVLEARVRGATSAIPTFEETFLAIAQSALRNDL
jgi:glycosyltransferase involved in cell wall biosynthesis